jgi:predicted RNase H-like HicB family nuclease
MLTKYIQAAMRRAKYEILEDDGSFYGEIPECEGVWANMDTLEDCRDELESVLEGWILLGIACHHPFPVLDGIEIKVPVAVA